MAKGSGESELRCSFCNKNQKEQRSSLSPLPFAMGSLTLVVITDLGVGNVNILQIQVLNR